MANQTKQYYKDFFDSLITDSLSRGLVTHYEFSSDNEEDGIQLILHVDNTKFGTKQEKTNIPIVLTLNNDGLTHFIQTNNLVELDNPKLKKVVKIIPKSTDYNKYNEVIVKDSSKQWKILIQMTN